MRVNGRRRFPDYHEAMPRMHRLATATLLISALALTSVCAWSSPAQEGAAAPQAGSENGAAEATDPAREAELLYEVLLGEISAQRGDPGQGYALMLDAARRSNDATLYRRATEIALQSRSAPSALIAAQAWQQAQPDSRDANRFVLRILVALNRVADSAQPLRQELAHTPPERKTLVLNAIPQLYAHVSDKSLAAQVVEAALADALQAPSTRATAWTTVGRMRLAANEKTAALLAAREAQHADATSDVMATLALQLLEGGTTQAQALLAPYLSGHPLPELRLAYARYLLSAEQPQQALTQLQALTRESPDNAEAWLMQGSLLVQTHRLDDADSALQHFAALLEQLPVSQRPRSATTQLNLLRAQIAEQRGDLAGAERWLDAIEDGDKLLSVQARRASILARQGKLGEAIAALRDLPAADTDAERQKLQAEALVLREVGQYARAYDALARAVALAPKDDDLAYEQAMLAEKLGRTDEMERLLRAILARSPDFHHAMNALGFSLADRGVRLEEAKRLITQALEHAPQDPYITDSLGWVEYRLGNYTQALALLETAYRRQPDAEIAAHTGEVLWKLGRRTRAREVWREGLRLNKDNKTLTSTLERLGVRL